MAHRVIWYLYSKSPDISGNLFPELLDEWSNNKILGTRQKFANLKRKDCTITNFTLLIIIFYYRLSFLLNHVFVLTYTVSYRDHLSIQNI